MITDTNFTDLRTKIIALFEYRDFPYLLTMTDFEESGKGQFWEELIFLQTTIYELDAVLESQWHVSAETLDKKWEQIYKALQTIGVPTMSWPDYSLHIHKYQKHELELRKGLLPTRLNFEYFYFYKSCDVKLLRRIIYDHSAKLKKLSNTADWRNFDLVTEINDDVADIWEDLETINGNRFLISLIELGKENTLDVFDKALTAIELQSQERYKERPSEIMCAIHDQTLIQVKETKFLMHENVEKFSLLQGLDSELYQHLHKSRTANMIC